MVTTVSVVTIFIFAFELVLETFIALYAQDCQTSLLASLCQAKKDSPLYTLGSNADWQQHLGKRQDIEWDAAQQHDDSSPERE